VEVARRKDREAMDAKLSQMAEMVSALASQTSSRLDQLLTIPQRRSLERSRPRSGQRAGCETEDRLQDGGRVAERNRPRRRRGRPASLSPVRARSPVRLVNPTVLVAPSQHHTTPPAELVVAPQPSVVGPPDTPPASATQRRRGFEYQADEVVHSPLVHNHIAQSPLTPGGLRA